MDRLEQLRTTVTPFDLSQHPFYVDWRRGTLPRERLAAYAAAFDAFIAAVPSGWQAAGRPDLATAEREHHAMWRSFAQALGKPRSWESPQARALTAVASNLFEAAPEAVGALYAFEAQQPGTARIKLDGLREHYQLDETGEAYFRVHADDWGEARLLEDMMSVMSEREFQRARSACAVLAAALWSGLDGVYYV